MRAKFGCATDAEALKQLEFKAKYVKTKQMHYAQTVMLRVPPKIRTDHFGMCATRTSPTGNIPKWSGPYGF